MASYNSAVPFFLAFGNALVDRGLDDKSAAPLFAVSVNTVNRWRNGRMVPGDELLPLLVQHLAGDEDDWARALRLGRALAKRHPGELYQEIEMLKEEVAALRAELSRFLDSPDGEPPAVAASPTPCPAALERRPGRSPR